MSGTARLALVDEKVTCPFLGAAVVSGQLPVLGDATDPLAAIDDVRRLGNTGGGDLGNLLAMFARGNHGTMRGGGDGLAKPVPEGTFSLELPGSQGSHPGHSGILQGDPGILGSGRLSRADFARLVDRAEHGVVRRRDVGRFIAENLARDPASKVFGLRVAGLLARDLAALAGALATGRNPTQKLTKLLGEDNLLGSAGEFGLLFAFLAERPGGRTVNGEPAVSVDDLRAMFVEKRLPDRWETWRKTRVDWLIGTAALAASAGRHYATLKHPRRSRHA